VNALSSEKSKSGLLMGKLEIKKGPTFSERKKLGSSPLRWCL